MKKMNAIVVISLALNIVAGACEFTITNDSPCKKIYISMNETLADTVSEETLKSSSSQDKNPEGKEITKKDFAIEQKQSKTTPVTKWFDIYVPVESSKQYQRLYHVKMNYCANDNTMSYSGIQNRTINIKRFTITDYTKGSKTVCRDCHAPTFEHQHEYEQKQESKTPELNEARRLEINAIADPLEGKTLLP